MGTRTFYQVHKFWSPPSAFNRFGDDFPAKISRAAAIWLILFGGAHGSGLGEG